MGIGIGRGFRGGMVIVRPPDRVIVRDFRGGMVNVLRAGTGRVVEFDSDNEGRFGIGRNIGRYFRGITIVPKL